MRMLDLTKEQSIGVFPGFREHDFKSLVKGHIDTKTTSTKL